MTSTDSKVCSVCKQPRPLSIPNKRKPGEMMTGFHGLKCNECYNKQQKARSGRSVTSADSPKSKAPGSDVQEALKLPLPIESATDVAQLRAEVAQLTRSFNEYRELTV